jgi:hypothetical protein
MANGHVADSRLIIVPICRVGMVGVMEAQSVGVLVVEWEWSKPSPQGWMLLILDLLSKSHRSIDPFLLFLSSARALQKIAVSMVMPRYDQENVDVVTCTWEMAKETLRVK